MPRSWHLGNDIVDLADPRHAGKAGDTRFLERVFSRAERDAIRRAPDPDYALWARWAGKEAAFKTMSKALGGPPLFNHPLFEVLLADPPSPEGGEPPTTSFGEVHYQDNRLPLRVEGSGNTLHALSWSARGPQETPPFYWDFCPLEEEGGDWRQRLRPRFTDREWACVSHRPSAMARLAAKASVAAVLGLKEGQVELGCDPGPPGRRIPRVFVDGKDAGVDLSLSHHGRLLAWAFLGP